MVDTQSLRTYISYIPSIRLGFQIINLLRPNNDYWAYHLSQFLTTDGPLKYEMLLWLTFTGSCTTMLHNVGFIVRFMHVVHSQMTDDGEWRILNIAYVDVKGFDSTIMIGTVL